MHTVEPFEIPKSWFRVKAVDYGYAAPSCCLWGAVDPDDGTIIIYRELYQKGLTADALGGMIVSMEEDEARDIAGVLDTAAWNRTGYTGPTIGETLCAAIRLSWETRDDTERVLWNLSGCKPG